MRMLRDFAVALQFLTRIPVPMAGLDPSDLSRAAAWFPLVGAAIGALAALLYHLLIPHLPRPLCALLVATFLVLITGGLHEDGLADSADGFGGGWNREQTLAILRDSRIGSYGALALILSLGARVLLLATMPPGRVTAFLVAAHTLCRWTALPLSTALAPARGLDGQGSRIAGRTGWDRLLLGTVLAAGIVGLILRRQAWTPSVATLLVTLFSGLYYRRRIDGITGDCMGATNQLAEIAVYLCGAWTL